MSHGKPKRYEMWMEGQVPFQPEISRLLPKLILELAMTEDVTGPWASEVIGDKYIAQLALRLREPVARALREAAIAVSEGELARICQVSASETFVIRRLNEGRLEGEVLVEDFRHLPLYRTYQDYFEPTAEIFAKALSFAMNAATSGLDGSPGTGKN